MISLWRRSLLQGWRFSPHQSRIDTNIFEAINGDRPHAHPTLVSWVCRLLRGPAPGSAGSGYHVGMGLDSQAAVASRASGTFPGFIMPALPAASADSSMSAVELFCRCAIAHSLMGTVPELRPASRMGAFWQGSC